MTGEDCHDHARRITIVETKVDMILPAIDEMKKKLEEVAATVNVISNTVSEQKGKADAKFGTSDLLVVGVVGAVGSYIVGTFLI